MPSEKLRRFLSELAVSPRMLGAFIQDPYAVMDESDLDEGDRLSLESGDPAKIHARLVGRPEGPPPTIVVVVDQTEAGRDEAPGMSIRAQPTDPPRPDSPVAWQVYPTVAGA